MSSSLTVPPSDIETQLTRIWNQLEGSNKIRACLFNLLIFTRGGRRSEYLHAVISKVIERFPSRVLFITKQEGRGLEMQAKISVISPSKEKPDVACDLIEIDISEDEENKIPFLVLPHILPDLPVYILWTEDPLEKKSIAAQIEKFATRMIFDSESTNDLPHFAKRILEWKTEFCCDIADLNWARIESWRSLLSATFYSREKLSQLKNAKNICITYNSAPMPFLYNTKTPAIYLQGWIASQLGWKYKKCEKQEGKQDFFYNKEDNLVSICLQSQDLPQLPAGNILSCKIETYNDEVIFFQRKIDLPQYIVISCSSKEKCDLPYQYIFSKSESGHSLVKEISHTGTSSHYLNLLQLISSIERNNLC